MNINYEGLVCYLNSNKDSKQNNVWLDSSGNNNNATLTSFSDNDFNGSYVQFNGNNYAVIPRCIQDDFTLSAEVILESSTSTAGPRQLWYNYASLIDAETSGVNNDFGLTISKDGHAYFGIGNPDRTIPYAQKSLFNEKHIITCTRKKDTGEYAMYIDGILIKKEIHPNKNSLTYPSEIYVGKGINNRFLSMKLFSIRIYNRVLDNFEIKQDSFFVKNKVYVNENNLPIIVDKLTDAKNIKIANNKYGNRVQTVIDKIVEKADDVTKAIKQEVVNDSYSFKVGTGNVDVSADVEDGFGEVGIKGVTYQNLFNDFSFSGESSKYITVNENTIKWTKSAVTTSNINIKYHNSLAQLGKTYTLVFYIYKNTLQREGAGDSYNVAKFNIVSYNGGVCLIPVNKTGLVKVKLIQPTTTPSDGKPYLEVYKDSVGEFEISYPILLEGDYTNDDKIPSQFEGIVGVGDKSKNLLNPSLHDGLLNFGNYFMTNESYGSCNEVTYSLKPNTNYTLSFEKYGEGNCWIGVVINGEYANNNNYPSFSKTITTDSTGVITLKLGANTPSDTSSKIYNLQLRESNSVLNYEPYYDGHKIEILSYGKNLTNLEDMPIGDLKSDGKFLIGSSHNYKVTPSFIEIEPIRKICLYYEYEKNDTSIPQHNMIAYYDENFSYLGAIYDRPPKGAIITPHTKAKYIRLRVRKETVKLSLVFSSDIIYEPYIEDKTQILLDEPLMRLPNGVCDEITRDGKLIRRVGKAVIDSSSDIRILDEQEMDDTAYCNIYRVFTNEFSRKHHTPMISNIMPYNPLWNCDNEGVNGDHETLSFRIKKSKLSELTSAAFREYLLSKNPVVYYQLAEPIVTELPVPCLRIFKGGHLTFNTLVAPESNHMVQLNKSAQIQNAIKESQSLDNRINVLENNYDNLMLSTISRLNDLELNYTLK